MRLIVQHETVYAYERPALSAVQILKLMPRNHEAQFVRRWRVEIDQDCRLSRDEDHYGNIVHTYTIDSAVEALRISVEGEVETRDAAGAVRGTVERLPIPYWLRDGALTGPDPAIARFARDIAAGEGGDRIAALHVLMTALHRDMAFTPGETDAHTTAQEAFAARLGVCQDFAHVFIVAARALGIPARYVGGYFYRSDSTEQEAGHAWAEAHIPELGWVGFDPANGVCVDTRHVRGAIGIDYRDAAPIRGARTGGGAERMSVVVHVGARRAFAEA
jgi:transglutaminase-like putative cysteine protease